MKASFFLLGTLLVTGVTNAQDIQRINPEGMSQPSAYHHVVRVDNVLFIAGQVGANASGEIAEGMEAQLRQVLENLKSTLSSQGGDFSNVVKINIFTTDVDAFLEAREVRQEYFEGHPPASTLVEVKRLARPAFLVEIEAIAILKEE